MTSEEQSYNTAEIRNLLATAFDDVGLVALCQDEFPDLCESLGRGLRKDEIINVIVDYFRRRKEEVPRLLTAIQDRPPKPREEPKPDDSLEMLLERARKLLFEGSLDGAIALLRRACSDYRGNKDVEQMYLEAVCRKGVHLYIVEQNLYQAKVAFQEVVTIDPHYDDATRLLHEVERHLKREYLFDRISRTLRDPMWQGISAVVGILACILAFLALLPIQDVLWPTPPPDFTGKVCEIKNGWDINTIFLRQAEFDTLELPIGTRVTVGIRDTGKSVEGVTLSLDSGLEIGSVRLSEPLREALDVDSDTTIQPISERPNRQFDITPTSSPTNREAINIQGRVCRIAAEQDTTTIFLRQAEFNAFGVPAGTTVSVTVFDTEKTVAATLGLDSDLAVCTVRLPKTLRETLGLAEDTDIEPPENRPVRQFSIRLPQP